MTMPHSNTIPATATRLHHGGGYDLRVHGNKPHLFDLSRSQLKL
jgi:hypothetical protein